MSGDPLHQRPCAELHTETSTVRTMFHALCRNASKQPSALAFRFIEPAAKVQAELTHAELGALVARHAKAIRAMHRGAQEQLKVVLALPQGPSFVAAFFACMAAQAIAVPTFPPLTTSQADRLKMVLLDLHECVVLAGRESLQAELAALRRDADLASVCWHAIEDLDCESAGDLADFAPSPDAIALLQYTSGSTGRPRGVVVSNRNLVENSEVIRHYGGHDRPGRRSVVWLPPHHDMGLVSGILQPVYAGFPTLLMPTSQFVRHPVRWLQAIGEFGATTSGGPNFAYQMCVDSVRESDIKQLDLGGWDVAFCGAEPISHETLRAFAQRFAPAGFREHALLPCYGMAEATLMVSGKPYRERSRSMHVDGEALAKGQVRPLAAGATGGRAVVSCGVVHESLDLRVVDPVIGIERAQGEIGELWVSGPSVAQGYWRQVEGTQRTFGQQLPGREGDYLRTGDLGFVDGDQLYVIGRLKELLIVRGANHYPQDLEREAILACLEFSNGRAVAFSVPGLNHEVVVLAIEVPRTPIDHDSVAKRINARLIDAHGIRAEIVLFLPRKTIRTTTSGKLQRVALKNDYLAGVLRTYHMWQEQTEDAAPSQPERFSAGSIDEVRRWIIKRIAAITRLDASRIRDDDRFSDLALDSLASLELLCELDEQHGICIAPDMLYRLDTPNLLAHEVHRLWQRRSAASTEERSFPVAAQPSRHEPTARGI